MTFDDLAGAVNDAKVTIRKSDGVVGEMAEIVAGRLRRAGVPSSVLVELKRELRNFDAKKRRWNDAH